MDLQNLMSCIQCHDHTNQTEVILETFKTIVQICTNESNGKDAFREEGGLEFLMEFLSKTDSSVLLEHSLKTLAFTVDENIPNQMHMTKHSVFEIIKAILLKENFHSTIHKNALLLLSAIMYQNNAAQILLYETETLQDLVSLYKCTFPTLSMNSSYSIPNMEEESVELWLRLNSTLCFAVNNPQNEKNQEICSVLFSPSLSVLETSLNNLIISAVCSFLSLSISNNANNQDYFAECDGLLTLKRCFQKHYDFLLLDVEECNNIIGKGTLQTLNSLIGIISAAVTNHEKSAYMLGKIGLVSLMIKLLFIDMLDIQLKTRLYLSLGHCVDASCSNKSYILETEKFDALLKKNLATDHDELSSACNYLLQVCILKTGKTEKAESNDNLFLSKGKRWMSAKPSLVSEKSFSNKASDFEVIRHKQNVTGPLYKFSSPESPDDIKMYLLSKTQGKTMDSLKISNPKGNNGVISRKRPSHTFPPSVSISDQNSKATISVFDSASEISFSPSNVSRRKRYKTAHTSINFSSDINIRKNKLKRKRNNTDSHLPKSIRSSSNVSCSLEDESREIKRSLESLEEIKKSIKNMNQSFNQIFSKVSNFGNLTVNQNVSESCSEYGGSNKSAVNSLMPRSRHEFSDITNVNLVGSQYLSPLNHCDVDKTHSYQLKSKDCSSTSKFLTDQRENCVYQNNSSKDKNYCQNLKDDQNRSFTCEGSFKIPSDQCLKSSFHPSLEFSENSISTRELSDFTFKPSMFASSCGEADSERISSRLLSSHLEEQSQPSKKIPDSNFIKVLVFPWQTCFDHGLISSFEMLQVVSMEDEDEF